MSVAQTAERISKQAGNGVTTAFSGSWKIFATTDLKVYKISAAGVYSALLTNGVDYTATFDTDAETWTVTYTVAPVSGGFAVVIGDSVPDTQAANFPREGVVPASTLKTAVDKLTVLVQQLRDKLERVPIQPITPVNANDQISISETPITRRALIYEVSGSTVNIVPSDYDPDNLVNEVTILAAAYQEGTFAARSAAPTQRQMYYATDTGELAIYIPNAGRWFTIG